MPDVTERIATLLIYVRNMKSFICGFLILNDIQLNDESLGGFTPFVDIGIAVPPLKGSGIFWYNLYRNGKVRSDTHHGACPIVYGHKIGNKLSSFFVKYRIYSNYFYSSHSKVVW
jgi:hypothetical protein